MTHSKQCHLYYIYFQYAECEQVIEYTVFGVHCLQSNSEELLNVVQRKRITSESSR